MALPLLSLSSLRLPLRLRVSAVAFGTCRCISQRGYGNIAVRTAFKARITSFTGAAMRSIRRAVVVGCVAIGGGIGAGVAAADWPQWRGPNRDGRAADFKAPAEWPKELKPAWKAQVGDGVSTPALVGERI